MAATIVDEDTWRTQLHFIYGVVSKISLLEFHVVTFVGLLVFRTLWFVNGRKGQGRATTHDSDSYGTQTFLLST